jgi:hypothetical protein
VSWLLEQVAIEGFRGINHGGYDMTSKPLRTIEWG